ncbi:MAG: Fic family protein [Candidatus Marinimicrobia bacterium]|nr:Fic family protein [Candidatus Neomarinimicrobiota bacterium]MDD4962113.1 Fic family protein [Candidatus Neomarinimicrobiota bacterium]
MKPPYQITPTILQLLSSVSEKIGEVNANLMDRPSPVLRKRSKARTIHYSLNIEGNTLTLEQVAALIEKKPVAGPEKDVLEVLNAVKVYDNIASYDPFSRGSFLNAHRQFMDGIIENAGKYRSQSVGIFRGSRVTHIAPAAGRVNALMNDLFAYLKRPDELSLIKSCVFHYEMEFIHPFMDGNGRMGRLWQTVILMNAYPVFEFLPFEILISKTQQDYYDALATSDSEGSSSAFIEYMLNIIDKALTERLNFRSRILSDIDRLEYFHELGIREFTRKDYMNVFKNLSSATASRDLKKGVEMGLFTQSGEKNQTVYRCKNNKKGNIG